MERTEFYGRVLAGLRGDLGRTGRYGVMYADIDGLKALNDEHGHLAGDRILAEVEAFVASVAGATGVATRFESDEFVAVFPLSNESQPVGWTPMECGGIPVSVSTGNADGDAATPSGFGETLERARRAMERSKGRRP